MDLQFEIAGDGLGFPEGPVAMADGSVLYVDIMGQTLSRLKPDKTTEAIAKLPGGPNGCAIGPDGAAYVCNNGGVYSFVPFGGGKTVPGPIPPDFTGGCIQRVDLASGAVTTLYDHCDGKPLVTPDDLVFDREGGLWFTDSGLSRPEGLTYGGFFYAKPDGSHIARVATIPMANGIGFSPDYTVLYVSDTAAGRLWALDVTGPGTVKPGPLPVMPGRCIGTLPRFQWVDSLKVEAGGKICVGTIFEGGITVFDPDGTTDKLALPDIFVTNLAFGGPDMMDVWITSSSAGQMLKARWPRPGMRLAFTA